ncbi:hypothetical protein HGM15179_004727, partial [Zosterops borbonicus]
PPGVGSVSDGAMDGTALHTKEEKSLPRNVYRLQCHFNHLCSQLPAGKRSHARDFASNKWTPSSGAVSCRLFVQGDDHSHLSRGKTLQVGFTYGSREERKLTLKEEEIEIKKGSFQSPYLQLCRIMSGGRKQDTKTMTNLVVTYHWKYCGIMPLS